ncbi:OsmC family protein [Aliiglaciecola sp. M165]|uniref:OsmC family protein n=1 Tax=Aliiglaciecola sp. M165 TaxID=2593649 RepID=UPI00118162B3|nr:OsmC family protein [Aliiglaciecola sp. M165]TRY30268.1 OsmC family protein [Aliiglaciecola sp. M165]
MQAIVNWTEDLSFQCKTDTGKTLTLDGNGTDLTPMEAVLLSVGACSSVDVVEIMKKARQPLIECSCRLTAKRADDAPRVFTDIHATYIVKGDDINEKHLKRAVALSTEKYCSVMLMLNAKVNITTYYVIE